MAALHVLGSIEGWYNVADAADRPRGQIKVSVTPLKQLDAPHATAALEFGAAPLQLTGPGQQQQQLSATRPQPSSDATSTCADTASANAAAELRAPRAAATAAAAGEGQLQDGLALWGSAGATVLDDEQGLSGDADQLLATLRANLEVAAGTGRDLGSAVAEGQSIVTRALLRRTESAATQQQQEAAAAAAAARAHAFRHVLTFSDDEEFTVAVGGVSESDTDTEELMGQVDWSLAQNSDDEWQPGPAGPPRAPSAPQVSAATPAAAAAGLGAASSG
ncbi:hypothetical protein OEZ85_004329 [Tetradesmus obliquus]|uniref:Uncharacterized protein n=1 Tax=Tetradesmus obliquus TaxID=3088 RepID=A0ABY8UKT8_TETOB|nr:hypothetical protein OEZ85_004329 [Tetradesmus obliquus]